MRKYLIGLTALFALVVVTSVSASFFTGNEMMQQCKDTKTAESLQSTPKYNACVSYLAGLADAQETLGHWKIVLNPLICVPENVNQEQLRQVFLGHMNRHPEKWHLAAASLALNAFHRAWPCKE